MHFRNRPCNLYGDKNSLLLLSIHVSSSLCGSLVLIVRVTTHRHYHRSKQVTVECEISGDYGEWGINMKTTDASFGTLTWAVWGQALSWRKWMLDGRSERSLRLFSGIALTSLSNCWQYPSAVICCSGGSTSIHKMSIESTKMEAMFILFIKVRRGGTGISDTQQERWWRDSSQPSTTIFRQLYTTDAGIVTIVHYKQFTTNFVLVHFGERMLKPSSFSPLLTHCR